MRKVCWGKTVLRDLCWANIWWKELWWEKFCWGKTVLRDLCWANIWWKELRWEKFCWGKTVLRDLLLRGHLMKKLLLRKGDGQNGSIWQNYFGSFRNWARLVLNYSFLQGQYLIGVSLRTIAGRGWGRSAARVGRRQQQQRSLGNNNLGFSWLGHNGGWSSGVMKGRSSGWDFNPVFWPSGPLVL